MQQSSKPMLQSSKPMLQSSKPMQQSSKPMQQSSKPMQQSSKPMQQSSKPMLQSSKPMQGELLSFDLRYGCSDFIPFLENFRSTAYDLTLMAARLVTFGESSSQSGLSNCKIIDRCSHPTGDLSDWG